MRTYYHRALDGDSSICSMHPFFAGDFMYARRFAFAALLAAGALTVGACGMMGMGDSMNSAMTVSLSAKDEVPPNASTGSGSARVELDGNVLKWTVTYSGL